MNVPALPEGYTLDQPSGGSAGIPPLPPGFTLDTPQSFRAPEGVDLGSMDQGQLKQWLSSVPEPQRDAARNAWADAVIAKQRAGGGTGQRIADAANRFTRYLPGGSFADELGASVSSAMGSDYDAALALNRARDRAIDAAGGETEKLFTIPGVNVDVHTSGLEKAAGALAGGALLPGAQLMKGAGFVPSAVNTAATAAGYGAVHGLGEGEGVGDRLGRAATEAAIGGAAGGALGGAVGKAVEHFSPAAARNAAQTPRGQVIEAADKLGMQLPDFLASDSKTVHSAASIAASHPLTGGIVRDAAQQAADDLGAASRKIANEYSSAGTGSATNAIDSAAAAEGAGADFASSLREWMGPKSRAALNTLYSRVEQQLPQDARSQLPNTAFALQQIMDRSNEATTPLGEQVFRIIGEAATNPKGLTYDGIKSLRTYVRNLENGHLLPEAQTLGQELKSIKEGLTQDLQLHIDTHGGLPAKQAFDTANRAAAITDAERKSMAKIVGNEKEFSASAASPHQVINRIIGLMGTGSKANEQRLITAMQKASPEARNEVAAAIIRRMGEGPSSNLGTPGMTMNWSPARARTFWGKFSENGKNAVFGSRGSPLRESWENIMKIAEKFNDISKFQNPSGTAHAATGLFLGGELVTAGPVGPLIQIALSAAGAKFLSRPATAKAIGWYGRAIHDAATNKGTRAAARAATMNLARMIADATGQDELEVRQRLAQSAEV